ncbi:unnamed protein product, partial [Mesorhabditis spiculigera]
MEMNSYPVNFWPRGPYESPGAVYETAAEGPLLFDCHPADYERLRLHSGSDPFLGTVPLDDVPQDVLLQDDPFADLAEELPWLEQFTDLSDPFPVAATSPFEELSEPLFAEKAQEIDWDDWSRFIQENHPECQLACGNTAPPSNEEYLPNFVVLESGLQQEPVPVVQTPAPVDDFLYEYEEPEEPAATPEPKPRRGRPPLAKQKRLSKKPRYSPYETEDDDVAPSDARRRALNRDAAFRYRERKKAEKDAFYNEVTTLESRNTWLHARVSTLDSEIARMRSHLKDLGAF